MAETWKCAGCGIAGPDKIRRCDCATNVVVSSDGVGAWKVAAIKRPNDVEAAAMVASLSPEAYAAWAAVVPLIGTDSGKFIASLVEAACVTAMASGCDPEDFARGVKAIWDDRAREFSQPLTVQ